MLLALTCGEDVKYPNDKLLDIGVLGTWEISVESINGITDMTVNCCRFMDFVPDDNNQDLKGRFIYRDGERQISEGFFTVNPNQETIFFLWNDDKELVYQYKFSNSFDYLTFTFSEDDLDFVQGWAKID